LREIFFLPLLCFYNFFFWRFLCFLGESVIQNDELIAIKKSKETSSVVLTMAGAGAGELGVPSGLLRLERGIV